MCLNRLLTEKQKTKILDKITRKGITVYKVIKVINSKFYPSYQDNETAFEEGTNIDVNKTNKYLHLWEGPGEQRIYKSGYHSYKTKKAAEKLLRHLKNNCIDYRLIHCKIHKSWILEIGFDHGITFVTSKIIFPKKEKD